MTETKEEIEVENLVGEDHPDDGQNSEHEDALASDEEYVGDFPEVEPDESEPPV